MDPDIGKQFSKNYSPAIERFNEIVSISET